MHLEKYPRMKKSEKNCIQRMRLRAKSRNKKWKFYLDLPNVCTYPIWNFPIFFCHSTDFVCCSPIWLYLHSIPFHSNFVWNREKITEGSTDMYVLCKCRTRYTFPCLLPALCIVVLACLSWKTKNNLKHRKYAHIVKLYRCWKKTTALDEYGTERHLYVYWPRYDTMQYFNAEP